MGCRNSCRRSGRIFSRIDSFNVIVVENFVLVVLVFGTCIVEMTNETSYKKIDESIF